MATLDTLVLEPDQERLTSAWRVCAAAEEEHVRNRPGAGRARRAQDWWQAREEVVVPDPGRVADPSQRGTRAGELGRASMAAQPIAIKSTGLVTSVGLSAPATCAAIRAKISNPTETRFIGSGGEWIMAHQVPLEQPWRGRTKLAKMAAMAISECLEGIPRENWPSIPLLLCVAEPERPGRLDGLDDQLLLEIQQELGPHFRRELRRVPHGRVSVAIALAAGAQADPRRQGRPGTDRRHRQPAHLAHAQHAMSAQTGS